MRRFTTISSLVLVVALGVAACGSSGGDQAAPTPTKAAYVKDGNQICSSATKALQAKAKAAGLENTQSTSKIVAYVKGAFLPSVHQQLADLRALGYPAGDKAKLEKLYTATETLLAKIDKDPKAFISDSDPFATIDKGLDAYGLTKCGTQG